MREALPEKTLECVVHSVFGRTEQPTQHGGGPTRCGVDPGERARRGGPGGGGLQGGLGASPKRCEGRRGRGQGGTIVDGAPLTFNGVLLPALTPALPPPLTPRGGALV